MKKMWFGSCFSTEKVSSMNNWYFLWKNVGLGQEGSHYEGTGLDLWKRGQIYEGWGYQSKTNHQITCKKNIQEDQAGEVAKTTVEISLRLCAKSPTIDQWDLRVEFMVQGKYSTLTYKQTTTNIFYIFSGFLLTNERNATYLYKMGQCNRLRMWSDGSYDLVL